jgi:hypothetical protein
MAEKKASDSARVWATGMGQNLKGDVLDLLCKQFVKGLPKQVGECIDSDCKSLFDRRNYARFRKQYIMALAAMYINGAVGQKYGKEIKILDKIRESAEQRGLFKDWTG